MDKFTTRVELHNASWDDYEKLHEKMTAEGFSSTITGSNGKRFHSPSAEYNFEGSATRAGVLERAKRAARAVKSSYAVLITESAGREWYGLDSA